MKYEEMSDFEINCAVAKALGYNRPGFLNAVLAGEESEGEKFDPCNSWANAGPISEENMISVDHHNNGSYIKVWGYSDAGLHSISVLRKDIKRGICVVFLMIKEGIL